MLALWWNESMSKFWKKNQTNEAPQKKYGLAYLQVALAGFVQYICIKKNTKKCS